ncbi:NRDE family protein [Bacillus sp. DNRA2]|uniref:NRDE family protein n=1 Tax=Bacillus sp. DNRA2 TaxID=2723053 RepID=UPI0032B7A831
MNKRVVIVLCLILFAYQVDPKYKLIVAANRDEFYARPTAPAQFWEDHPDILAGRDLKQMGTWMGITKSGKFAALTNYRDPSEITDGNRSRGELVGNFLKEEFPPQNYLESVAKNKDDYPGFNLLVGDANQLFYYANIENEIHELQPGVYGLSNHLLNTEWPKVKIGKAGLQKIISTGGDNFDEELFALLQNADEAPDIELPKTGVTLEWERVLSALFIQSENYGTRSSTILKMTDAEIEFKEKVYAKERIIEQTFTVKYK